MSANPGLSAIIQNEIQNALSDPSGLPGGFWDYAVQHSALNPVSVQATISPTIIASGVGSTSNSPTRYVGGTASGAPASGTYVAGDFVVSHDGHVYVCTATGAPGTWSTWPAQGEIAYNQITATVNVASTTAATPTNIISGTAVAYTGVPVYIEIFSPQVAAPTGAAGDFVKIQLQESGSILGVVATVQTPVSSAGATNLSVPVYAQLKFTPSAGTHTYSVSAYASSTTGTPAVGANAHGGSAILFPAFIRVRYA